MNPKISIIVPVYKVEKYIHKCIDSILAQTFTDFELILVDDGSPDNCGKICDEYAEKDSRIVVIHKENGGQSAARNSALDIAKGDFIGFVDSDDYIDLHMYELLYNSCIENNSDISIIGVCEIDENGKAIHEYIPNIKNIRIQDILKRAHPWNKLFKKSLFCDYKLRFIEGKLYEDLELIPKLFIKANKVSCVSCKGYNYLQRRNSTTHLRNEKILDNIWAYIEIKKYLIKENMYKQYEEEFKEGVEYFKGFYINILYTYPSKFLISNYKFIINDFKKITNISKIEYLKFILTYIKIKIYKLCDRY